MDPRYLVVYLGWERKRYWLSGWSWTNRMGFHGISLAMESINFMGFRKERDTFWILLTHHSSRWNPCFHREKTWPRNWNPRKELEVSKFELGVIFSSHPFRTMGFSPEINHPFLGHTAHDYMEIRQLFLTRRDHFNILQLQRSWLRVAPSRWLSWPWCGAIFHMTDPYVW